MVCWRCVKTESKTANRERPSLIPDLHKRQLGAVRLKKALPQFLMMGETHVEESGDKTVLQKNRAIPHQILPKGLSMNDCAMVVQVLSMRAALRAAALNSSGQALPGKV